MILSDRDIRIALKEKTIVVKPSPDFKTQLGSCSLDLRLGKTFRIFNHSEVPYIDVNNPKTMEGITQEIVASDKKPFILHPHEFALAMTMEWVEIPDNLTGRLEGRSSIGRLGIVIHSTAAHIECGFRGNITLELANMGRIPVMLYPGMRICSISFEQLSSPAEIPYYKKKTAKYLDQKRPEESRIGEEK